ncbi:STAS-like domain-containing protein [Achromobacter insolitus]|uniref:STAS-like domain-containing protein n=1 Tax=Achromobacter insolitus TaxID=217204 RepID=UPI001CD2C400|nr:STAS-like domain-containing protein [Achromobacter insolitus]
MSTDDGQRVHDAIATVLRTGKAVSVSFSNIETLISAFLNAAIGQLYDEFSDHEIKNLLSVTDMRPEDLALLKRVVDNAKIYFQNREKLDSAWKGEVGDEE